MSRRLFRWSSVSSKTIIALYQDISLSISLGKKPWDCRFDERCVGLNPDRYPGIILLTEKGSKDEVSRSSKACIHIFQPTCHVLGDTALIRFHE